MSVPRVPLGNILMPAPVRRAGNRDYPLLSMTMRDGLVEQGQKFKKRVASRETDNYRVVRRGELVVGFPIDEAVLATQRIVDEGIVSPAYSVWSINNAIADAIYLERFLRSSEAISYYKANLRGTTARRRTLPPDKFHDMPVPLPSLERQRLIASMLEKADAIRCKRAQCLLLVDKLLRSIFVEMFGDPALNEKGLPKKPLGAFGKIVTGNTPSRSDPDNFGTSIEWIKSDNIVAERYFLSRAAEGLSEKGSALGRTVPKGSILVTCIAGSPSSIGRAAIADRPVALNQQINAITPNKNVDLYFLYTQFLIGKSLILRSSTNSMKGMVSKGEFQKIEFLCPEQSEQRKFGRIFEKHVDAARTLRADLDCAENLFRSLSQHAFQGEF